MANGVAAPDGFRAEPLWWRARAANAAGRAAEVALRRPLQSLDPDTLLTEATRRTGLSDLGVDWPETSFSVLAGALDTEARLTPTGRRIAARQLVGDVAMRLRVVDELGRRPRIARRRLRRPLLMVNLPRSGSTLLQFLLARAPEMRSLLPEEVADPLAAERGSSPEVQAVRRRTARHHKTVDRLLPAYGRIHPMEADEPEEVNALLARSVSAFHLGAIYRIPSYVDHLLQGDLHPAYGELRTQVQLIQGRERPRTWVLRTPAFVFDLRPLLNTFPDAVVVWLHRDPLTCITSFCSLVATVRAAASAEVDPLEIGPAWTELWARGLERSLAARAYAPSGVTFVDLDYRELVADPLKVLDRVRRTFASDPEPLDEPAIEERVAAGRSGPPHRYEPEWFGLEAGAVTERFAGYRERFDLG